MPLIDIFEQHGERHGERLPWEIVSNIVGFLPTQDFLSLLLVNKEHYHQFHEEFVRQNLPAKAGAQRDWALILMYINALRYDSVELLKQFLSKVEHDRAVGRPMLFNPIKKIGDTPGFEQFGLATPYDPSLPFLPSSTSTQALEDSHLRFCLIKPFTYIGLAAQADAPNVLSHLYNLPNTKQDLLNTTTARSYAWYTSISTLAKALGPDALQNIKDEALHIAAKAAFPRITRLLLTKGANPNSRCMITDGTTSIQEVLFHPSQREEGEGTPEATVHVCPWRWYLYAVSFIVFYEHGAQHESNYPVVTGCSKPHKRLANEARMCLHGSLIGLDAQEMNRPAGPRRVFHGYRVLHTLLALVEGGADVGLAVAAQAELEENGTHEEVCAVNQGQLPGPVWMVHGMRAPRELVW